MRALRLVIPALVLLLACGGGGGGGQDGGGDGGSSDPIDLPEQTWTWVDVPGAICADGSATGIAVNRGTSASSTVVLFLNGGGACWSSLTCLFRLADPGPYGRAQFEEQLADAPGTILDRTVADPIFGDATLVFVPYCTGDVHWGSATSDYGDETWRHAGKANLAADVDWLKDNLAEPARLVVSGSSAGGFGSALAHDLARKAWPSAKGYLIDDSGPPLVGGDIDARERDAWTSSWGLDQTFTELCPDCTGDLSLIISTLAAKYPQDRIALLSSKQDGTISQFFLYDSGADFEPALLRLVDQRITPLTNARAFLTTGGRHTMLQDPANHAAGGVALPAWLGQMVNDDPAWVTAR